MNVLIIDNQIVANYIASKREDITVYDGDLSQSVETVAEDIKNRFAERADLYIIGCHAQIGNSNLSDNSGIRLLKLLRLHRIDDHVALYSWTSREMLMYNLQNAIVFSKGVSFFRLPNFSNSIKNLDFSKLSVEKADKNELMQLFRAEYDPDNRHFDANKLGVWQLMRVQDAYDNIFEYKEKQKDDYQFRKAINDFLNSYYGKLVQYVYGQEADNLDDELRKATSDRNEEIRLEKLEQAKEALDNIEIKLDIVQHQIGTANKLILTDSSEIYQELSRRKQKEVKEVLKKLAEREIAELSGLKEELEKSKQYYINIRNWTEQTVERPDGNLAPSDFNSFSIQGIRKNLVKRKPRVIYVDDMAEEGWTSILKRIIYKDGANNNCFRPIAPAPDDSVETIVEKICEVENPDLIILDLRLKDERGYYAPADLSGFQVLQELDKKNLPCAILVFTASNKIWSLKEAFKGNVISYWIKGGLNELDEKNAYINNYLNLIEQINNLVQIKFVFEKLVKLKDMAKAISDSQQSFWWETLNVEYMHTFTDNNKEKITQIFQRKLTEKQDVVNNINMVIESVQNNLRQMCFQSGNVSLPDIFNIMVMQQAYIVEDILQEDSTNHPCSLSYKLEVCTPDMDRGNITNIRNLAAHSRKSCHDYYDIDNKINIYIKAIENFLFYNYPDTNKNKEGKSAELGANSIEETSLIDRIKKLNKGHTITVRVAEKVRYNQPNEATACWLYNFIVDQWGNQVSAVLTDDKNQKLIDAVEEGDYIKVKQDSQIIIDGRIGCKIIEYYKAAKEEKES